MYPHTHTPHIWFCYTCEDFHRLLLFLYWPNNIVYCPTPTLPSKLNPHRRHFAFLHFKINLIWYFFIIYLPCEDRPNVLTKSKSQALLSLWGHLVLTSIAKPTHTHSEREREKHFQVPLVIVSNKPHFSCSPFSGVSCTYGFLFSHL